MTEETSDLRFQRIEMKLKDLEERQEKTEDTVYGEKRDGSDGILADFRTFKAESTYLKMVYILVTSLVMVVLGYLKDHLLPLLFPGLPKS